jgi:hypothetical protein
MHFQTYEKKDNSPAFFPAVFDPINFSPVTDIGVSSLCFGFCDQVTVSNHLEKVCRKAVINALSRNLNIDRRILVGGLAAALAASGGRFVPWHLRQEHAHRACVGDRRENKAGADERR